MYSYTPEVILLLVLIKYAKMSYFVPLGYIAVVGIQVEKNLEVIRMKNVPKGGVIKGTCMYSYQGCKNPVFYSKYIINESTGRPYGRLRYVSEKLDVLKLNYAKY